MIGGQLPPSPHILGVFCRNTSSWNFEIAILSKVVHRSYNKAFGIEINSQSLWVRVVCYAPGTFKVCIEGMVVYTVEESHLIKNRKFRVKVFLRIKSDTYFGGVTLDWSSEVLMPFLRVKVIRGQLTPPPLCTSYFIEKHPRSSIILCRHEYINESETIGLRLSLQDFDSYW